MLAAFWTALLAIGASASAEARIYQKQAAEAEAPTVGGSPSEEDEGGSLGPGPVPVDVFHPERDKASEPRFGGSVVVHVASLPKHMNYVTDNSGTARRMLLPTHETLLIEDWEYHDFRPRLCTSYVAEDLVVLEGDRAELLERYPMAREVRVVNRQQGVDAPSHRDVLAVFGSLAPVIEDSGSRTLRPLSKGHPAGGDFTVREADVASIELGAVMSFALRDDVLWHPRADEPATHRFDAHDVRFSWEAWHNPAVDCDAKRFQLTTLTDCEVVDDHYVRFFYEQQYSLALRAIGTNLVILPRHVYDLGDPDNPDFAESFTQEEQGNYVNEHPRNRMWIGLGPYRISEWSDQAVVAERFVDADGKALYFDRERAGFLDSIRWRVIPDDTVAMGAVLNDELDYFERMSSEDYFGGLAESEAFQDSHYKGFKYTNAFSYLSWNMYRPKLAEKVVRDALELAFDSEAYRRTGYRGQAQRITGSFPYSSAAYNHGLEVRPFDPAAARDMLDDAGWYDRNGDGTRDKNGVELEIEFLYFGSNPRSSDLGLAMKDNYAEIGVRLVLVGLEWVTLSERMAQRDFDSINLGWLPELESDPEQLWHSTLGGKDDFGTSNHAGVMDELVDKLIADGQRELDRDARMGIWRELHRRLYEDINPYLFLYRPAYRVAISKQLRGVQFFAIDPTYSIRRWHRADATRTTLDR